MIMRKLSVVLALIILLIAGAVKTGLTGQGQLTNKEPPAAIEILRVMGKGVDYIVVGEQPLYVVPEITKITGVYGTAIDLGRLKTPCLAEVTYVRWLEGVETHPVVLHLRVKKVFRGASSENSREEEVIGKQYY
ncbi:MAG: hypothetical protein P8X92_10045, partial [Dehalococcoidia bacterium]